MAYSRRDKGGERVDQGGCGTGTTMGKQRRGRRAVVCKQVAGQYTD